MSVIKNWHAKQKRRRFYYVVQAGLLVATWVLIKINLCSKLVLWFSVGLWTCLVKEGTLARKLRRAEYYFIYMRETILN